MEEEEIHNKVGKTDQSMGAMAHKEWLTNSPRYDSVHTKIQELNGRL
jgi:hypothetical protein